MRTETEMMELILSVAKEDERIRAVYMNGSRTNPNAPKDLFQDYDIVYVVRETESFQKDKTWIDHFGDRLYMQYPDEFGESPSDISNCYGWLIQFSDGNRLDLHVQRVEFAQKEIKKDRLCIILLDKDHCLPPMPPATDADFFVKRPTQKQFSDTCNEFWWCLNNVGKGLWRGEITYAQDMMALIRQQLLQVLSWKAGLRTDFSCSIGKSGKYLPQFLSSQDWESYLTTYASANCEDCWNATISMCRFFDFTAKSVAEKLGFCYNVQEAKASFQFFLHTRALPADAKEIYP